MRLGAKSGGDKTLQPICSDVELTYAISRAQKLRSGSFLEHTRGVLGHLQHAVSAAEHNRDRTLGLYSFHDAAVSSWEDLRTPLYKESGR